MAGKNKKTDADKVEGVLLAEAREEVVDRFIAKFGIQAGGELRHKVEALARHLKENTPKSRLADCDRCKGDSDIDLECCPYCGDGDEEQTPQQVNAIGDALVALAKEEGAKPPGKPAKPPKPDSSKNAAALAKAASKALSKSDKVKTEADLDAAVKRVNVIRRAGAMCAWELGVEIGRIFDERLYILRTTKDGHVRYKNWSQFCQVELGMSRDQSYKLIDVARLFKREDVERLGTEKLSLMVQVPEGERQRLLEAARAGMSKRGVKDEIRLLGSGSKPAGSPRDPTGARSRAGAAGKAASQQAARPRDDKSITVVTQLGRTTIKLFARPKAKGADPKRATSLAQDPFGEERPVNGIRISYRIVKTPQGLALIVDRKREESSE
jgi:hypothetical protein